MMAYYFVKADLFGVKRGVVERFADYKAAALLTADMLERFDGKNKKHREAPGAEPALALEEAKKGA